MATIFLLFFSGSTSASIMQADYIFCIVLLGGVSFCARFVFPIQRKVTLWSYGQFTVSVTWYFEWHSEIMNKVWLERRLIESYIHDFFFSIRDLHAVSVRILYGIICLGPILDPWPLPLRKICSVQHILLHKKDLRGLIILIILIVLVRGILYPHFTSVHLTITLMIFCSLT